MTGMPLSEDGRFEMSMRAASRERRNRPVGVVVLACAALAVAGIAAGTGLLSRRSAMREQRLQMEAAGRASALLGEYRALKASEQAGLSGEAHKDFPFLVTKLGDLASRAGLTDKPAPPREPPSRSSGGVMVKEYIYQSVRADRLEPLLEWIRLGTREIPGLELYQIPSLKPDATGWTMHVNFRRWEHNG
jgi:hypothetical protein